MRWFASLLMMLVLGGQTLLCLGCGREENRDKASGNPVVAKTSGKTTSEWVDELRAAYLSGGLRAFHVVRKSMIANDNLLPDDLDHDTAAMVLGLGETGSTRKEAKLTAQLRNLAAHIEEHPGRSRAQQEELEGKLFSYSFGNGPIDHDSVPAKLAALYSLIANGEAAP